jgi:aminoglycoside phosphotransferase (APT) family kinase protein
MNRKEVKKLFKKHHIPVSKISKKTGSFQKDIFFVNNEYILRPSKVEMKKEQENFKRIEKLSYVPRILFWGRFRSHNNYYYTILNMLPGIDFIDAVSHMTGKEQETLGEAVSDFLDALHSITGPCYDIGHYVPLVPHFAGTWKQGHKHYWEYLKDQVKTITISKKGKDRIHEAFHSLNSMVDVLGFEVGPHLLHNDFHPKNIIVQDGIFSGVIDWECSQFGEPDFEMCHLIHWCLYPPHPGINFIPFLSSIFDSHPRCLQVPNLVKRLTIYEIEHEIFQLLVSKGHAEDDRIPRLVSWIEGGAGDLLKKL